MIKGDMKEIAEIFRKTIENHAGEGGTIEDIQLEKPYLYNFINELSGEIADYLVQQDEEFDGEDFYLRCGLLNY